MPSIAQWCWTLLWPHGNYSLPGSSVRGISQAIILKWVAISCSRESSWPRNRTCIPSTGRLCFTTCTTWEATLEAYSLQLSSSGSCGFSDSFPYRVATGSRPRTQQANASGHMVSELEPHLSYWRPAFSWSLWSGQCLRFCGLQSTITHSSFLLYLRRCSEIFNKNLPNIFSWSSSLLAHNNTHLYLFSSSQSLLKFYSLFQL